MRPSLLIALCILSCFLGTYQRSNAQSADTLKITLTQAEDMFVKNNLQLIIQRYNIDNSNAQVITARLFQNPNFSFSNGLHATGVPNGYSEQTLGISQLFSVAGKRNKNVKLARLGVEQTRYQFFDLLRTLKFTLRNDFYSIYFQEQSAKVYDQEISSLAKTLSLFKEQYAKGNIAEKEVLRIQSQLYALQVEFNSLQTGIDTVQSEFKLLVKADPGVYIAPQFDYDKINSDVVQTVPYQKLLDSAYANRYDLKLAKTSIDYNNANLQLQKAIAVPDLSFSINYDKLGGYGQNFLGAGVAFDLPFFNRNQGGVSQARIAIDQSKVQFQNQQNQIESDLATDYKNAVRLEKLYDSFDPSFKQNFNHLIQQVSINYQKRNIGLLEFLDFYDSYKTNVIQLNNLELSRVLSLEQLNYATATPFFN